MFYLILLLITTVQLFKNSFSVEQDGDKLILKPVELIDLVIQEQMRKEMPAVRRRFKENVKSSTPAVAALDIHTGM